MKRITYVQAFELISEAKKKINNVNVILDVGCGIRPQSLTNTFIHICVDAHKEYLDLLRETVRKKSKFKAYLKYMFLNTTIESIISKFPLNSIDTIFLLDVIEHIEKPSGYQLIEAINKIARHQIIIFTPLGFVSQEHPDGKDAWGLDGGKWQEHKSGWLPDDFDDSWEFVVCKDFHVSDNMGFKHENPVGAFFAIKTINKQPPLIFRKSIFSKVLFWLKTYVRYKTLNYSLNTVL